MKTNQKGVRLTAGCNADDPHSLLFYFQQVFLLEHLPIMTVLTNVQLQLIGKPITNQEEILKFFWGSTANPAHAQHATLGVMGLPPKN